MIYVELSGGLGNQFFQYAMARKIQLDLNESVSYCYEGQKGYLEAKREISIDKFAIASSWNRVEPCPYYRKHKLKLLIEKVMGKIDSCLKYDDNRMNAHKDAELCFLEKMGILKHQMLSYKPLNGFQGKKEIYISGLWHHPMYFTYIRDQLLEEFRLKDCSLLPPNLLERIVDCESVAVHIRRGDYLKYPFYIVADIDYYKRAIRKMKELHPSAEFFIFSDDIAWVKMNLDENVTYVDGNNPDYIDMELMRNCKHFVISNSTFSWWAAFLGQACNKTVITPDKWYSDGRNKEWLNLPGWIVQETGV